MPPVTAHAPAGRALTVFITRLLRKNRPVLTRAILSTALKTPWPETGRLGLRQGRSGRVRLFAMLLIWLLGVAVASGQAPGAASLPTITRIDQIRRMTPEEAQRGYPTRIRGVVTYYNMSTDDLFIQDSTAGIWVDSDHAKPDLHVGEFVEVEGESGVGDFAPEVDHPRFRALGEAPMPAPATPTSDELASGRQDSQWIEIQGVVHSAVERDGGLVLKLSSGAFECSVFALRHPTPLPEIVDARVRVRGVFAGVYDSTATRFVGFQILTATWNNVQILERPAQGMFSLPLRPIALFLRLTPEGVFTHRVHVRGTVLLQRLGRFVVIRDQGLSLWVRTTQPLPLQVGDLVDAVGFPAVGDYRPAMRDAVLQRIGHGRAPVPVAANAERLKAGDKNAELVRVSALLLNHTSELGEEVLELQAGSVSFQAELNTQGKTMPLRPLRNRSLLQLTGVSQVEVDENGKPEGFRIILRSADDVVTLKNPTWWTGGRVMGLLTLLAAAILLGTLWVIILRRRVEVRTETVRATLESTADGILVVNSKGRIVAYNRKFADMTHIPEAILKSQDYNAVVNYGASQVENPDAFEHRIRQVLGDADAHANDVVQLKDGRVFERHSEPQRVKGKSVGRVWAFRDITSQRQAEVALREASDRLNLALKSAKAGTWNWDAARGTLRWDNQVCALYGLVPGKWERDYLEHFRVSVHPDDLHMAKQQIVRSVRHGGPFEFESRVTWSDGSVHVLAQRGEVCWSPQGKMLGTTGITWEITERKRAEEMIRASEERYREIFENASDILFTTSLEGQFTSLNRAGRQLLGYSCEEITQLNIRQLVDPQYWDRVNRTHTRLLQGNSDVANEVEVHTKDGRRALLEVHQRLISREGTPLGMQAIARDITGRDVAEMELRQAQKLESVGRLASGIAHEINTPIQFVGDNTRFVQESFGCLEKLLKKYRELRDAAAAGTLHPGFAEELRRLEEESDYDFLVEEIPKALSQTLEGVTRVATIVRAMKDFAHPDDREMAAADLNLALLSTLTVARNELKYVADVETDLGEIPPVVCSVGDMNQVFLNLLVNAAHAIGDVVKGTGQKGKIRVHTSSDGQAVLISIADTGGGIPEGIRNRVFDPFFTTKEVGRGTGQGLAIARSVVVDRHKGSLTFDSELGKGTTFYIRLNISSDSGETARN